MIYPEIRTPVQKHKSQELQMQGINLTDNYTDGQMESSKGINTDRFPYITTDDQPEETYTGISEGYKPISMFAWEKLFVVSNEPNDSETGFKCYYGGEYCGDAVSTDLPKQYAVINSKLVMFPDKVYFNLLDNEMKSHPISTAPLLIKVTAEKIEYRKAAT